MISASLLTDSDARVPRACISVQSVGVSESGDGGHRRFFSVSSSRVASRYPISAAARHGKPARTGWIVIALSPQIGISGGYCSPAAAQWTTTASLWIAASPSSNSMRPRSIARMCPSRTTRSMLRNRSSSHWASVGVFAIVGVKERSMRSITPAASRRRNRSSGHEATDAASMMSAAIPVNTVGLGWTTARLSIHGSRGRTQQIDPGSTPRPSSHTQVSVAVFPDPTITNSSGAVAIRGNSWTGSTRTPSATPNGGAVVAGISGPR